VTRFDLWATLNIASAVLLTLGSRQVKPLWGQLTNIAHAQFSAMEGHIVVFIGMNGLGGAVGTAGRSNAPNA
jgi:hypothetical protein